MLRAVWAADAANHRVSGHPAVKGLQRALWTTESGSAATRGRVQAELKDDTTMLGEELCHCLKAVTYSIMPFLGAEV